MITEQKIKGKLTFYGEPSASQIYELSDKGLHLTFGGCPYYMSTTGRGLKEGVIVFPFWEINALAPEDTVEIWGSGSKYLPSTEKEFAERVIEKEIDVDNLSVAIDATEEEVNQWLALLLEDYDIESTVENIEDASSLIRFWLEQQASKSGLKLKEDELSKLFRFAVRLAYEALYVGSV